jgi:hypothetical protein
MASARMAFAILPRLAIAICESLNIEGALRGGIRGNP